MYDPPCGNCDKRTVGCHSDCNVYKAWLSKYHKLAERRRLEYDLPFAWVSKNGRTKWIKQR